MRDKALPAIGKAVLHAWWHFGIDLDQACIDMVYRHQNEVGDDATSLINRIEKQHGLHILEHAEKIGLGSRQYKMEHLH